MNCIVKPERCLFLGFILIMLSSCKCLTYQEHNIARSITIDGSKYQYICKSNKYERLEGYYRIAKDSFLYISLYDYANRDTFCLSYMHSKLQSYCLFVMSNKEPYNIDYKICDPHPNLLNGDLRVMRNIVYPFKKKGLFHFSVLHVATEYDSGILSKREFIVNKKLKILKFNTLTFNKINYFSYD